MSEYTQIQREIARRKIAQTKANKLATARSELRELKYGKYLAPGRKIGDWGAKQFKKARKKEYFNTNTGNDLVGNVDFGMGGGSSSSPLADLGDPFGSVSLGNPFGESAPRTVHHRRKSKPKVRIVYRSRPRRRRYYYRWGED